MNYVLLQALSDCFYNTEGDRSLRGTNWRFIYG